MCSRALSSGLTQQITCLRVREWTELAASKKWSKTFQIYNNKKTDVKSSFVFVSMLSTLMTHVAERLGCVWCCKCSVHSGRINLCLFGNASLHVGMPRFLSEIVKFHSDRKKSKLHKPLVQCLFYKQQPDWMFLRYI